MPGPGEPDGRARLGRDLRRGTVLAALAATGAVFIVIDSRSHSVSDTFYGMVIPETVVLALAALAWLAVGRWSAGD